MPSSTSNFNAGLLCGAAILVIAVLLILFGDRDNPMQKTRDRMQRLERAILSYVDDYNEAPESLAELKLPEEDLQDHLGEPFRYTVKEGSVTLTSYGSDKKPGGFLFKRDRQTVFELPQTK
jgi:hypothetical protein